MMGFPDNKFGDLVLWLTLLVLTVAVIGGGVILIGQFAP